MNHVEPILCSETAPLDITRITFQPGATHRVQKLGTLEDGEALQGRGAPGKLGAPRKQVAQVATGKLGALEGSVAKSMRRTRRYRANGKHKDVWDLSLLRDALSIWSRWEANGSKGRQRLARAKAGRSFAVQSQSGARQDANRSWSNLDGS